MSSRQQPKKSELSSHSTIQQQKLSGKHERESEWHSESEMGGNKHNGSKKSKLSSVNSSRFPCPFALRDPAKYGGENGCSNYSRPIETVIRHHVLGKHRKEHRDAGNEDDIFRKVEQLVGKSGSKKQKAPEELWRLMYKALFEVDSSEEDTILDPSSKTNARAMDVDSIHAHVVKCVATNPLYPVEVVNFIEEINYLKRQRAQAKDGIRRAAEKEISAIHDRAAADLQRVNAYYDEKVRNVRAKLQERVTCGSWMSIEDTRPLPSVASLDVQSNISSTSLGLSHAAAASLTGISMSPYVASQAPVYDATPRSYASPHVPHSAPASETVLQLPSDGGYYSLDKVGSCEHSFSDDVLWCDDCLALFRND